MPSLLGIAPYFVESRIEGQIRKIKEIDRRNKEFETKESGRTKGKNSTFRGNGGIHTLKIIESNVLD